MFDSLLVHLGSTSLSAPAWRRGLALARAGDAGVELLTVVPDDLRRLWEQKDDPRTVRRRERAEWQRRLDEMLRPATERPRSLTAHWVQGDPGARILEAARGHDLVILEAHQGFSQSHEYLGGLDRRLLRACPVPVWFERGRLPAGAPLLASVDARDDDRRALNARILRVGGALAALEGRALHVVQVVDRARGDAGATRSRVRRAERALERLVDEALEREALVTVLVGDPVARVLEHAADLEAGGLVVGTVDVRASEHGVAEELLLRARGPVVSVKPAGHPVAEPGHAPLASDAAR